jgi:hypothetical protein
MFLHRIAIVFAGEVDWLIWLTDAADVTKSMLTCSSMMPSAMSRASLAPACENVRVRTLRRFFLVSGDSCSAIVCHVDCKIKNDYYAEDNHFGGSAGHNAATYNNYDTGDYDESPYHYHRIERELADPDHTPSVKRAKFQTGVPFNNGHNGDYFGGAHYQARTSPKQPIYNVNPESGHNGGPSPMPN